MSTMLIQSNDKTNWFHLAVIIVVTIISFYFIKTAFEKPFAQIQAHNEIRAAEIEAIGN